MRYRVALLALPILGLGLSAPAGAQTALDGRDDAVVVAVLDSGFSPYHWDFLGSKMPQHQDANPGNDLPVDQAPDTWISDFPDPGAFASFSRLDLTLEEENAGRTTASLQAQDSAEWAKVKTSTSSNVHYSWIPDTKIVGAVRFGNPIQATNADHGSNTSAVSVGNIHGTCQECVVVLVTYGGADREAANNWALEQPWIDVITHSYGYSTTVYDKIYSGSDLARQLAATERGQTLFWSASNGQANAFDAPTTTYLSSSKGPDWLVTVGATAPSGSNYTGSGKTADIASIGSSYPSMGGTTVNGNGTFSGTSNATPVVAGMFSRALGWARQQLDGPSRTQRDGVVATGAPITCGGARPACELADGVLTADELRTRLLHGAIRTPEGPTAVVDVDNPVTTDEYDFASEGHGTYFAHKMGAEHLEAEMARITGPMNGTAVLTQRPAGERDWMIVDSFCRQAIWGRWGGGYYVNGSTQLPADNPLYPVRTALRHACERALFDQLPNLVPLKPTDIHVGPTDDSSGEAVRFTVSTANRSKYALDMTAVPNSGYPNTSDAYQCVMWSTDRVCQERVSVGSFTFHQSHLHYHFEDYALYELRQLKANGEPDMSPSGLAAPGRKASFCLLDYDQDRPPDSPLYELPWPPYLTCTASFGVGVQGISPGWMDTYVYSLDGQQIPVAGVQRGRDYAVVITADPLDLLWETNESDNVSWAKIRL
jgi:hypothetical protein